MTTYGLSGSGALKEFSSGASLAARVSITSSAVSSNTIQGHPFYATPASIVFDGIVDLAGYPFPALEMTTAAGVVTNTFSGLDPSKEYNFQGTAIRGNINYSNRWTIFEIVGAASFTSRHSAGSLTTAQVGSLAASQVVLNTGDNAPGRLVWWEHIRPSAAGTFSVTSRKYSGPVPPGFLATGSTGYALTGFRLEEAGVYSGRTNLPPRLNGHSLGGINGINTIWVVVMENSDWSKIKGSTNTPYISGTLLPQAAWCEGYYNPPGLHPSLPNYLWLMTGTNFGIQDDLDPAVNHQSSTNTLFHLLDAAGIPWRCYAENVTGTTCPDAANGDYAARHVPFVYFDTVRTNFNNCTNHIRPFPELGRDLTNGNVARFNFLVPNRTNDMHDPVADRPTAIKQGDTWLAQEMPKILSSAAYQNGGLLIIAFDEGDGSTGDGPIGAIFLSPRIKAPGFANTNFYDHSSMLRTWQDIYGLQPYLSAAVYANDMSEMFKTLEISSLISDSGGVHITLTNLIANRTNYVLSSIEPTGPWQAIRTNVAASAGQTITIPAAAGTGFYRVKELP
ncbi:MAG TPA: alkaline phosphatase family protein [Candidatus Saccharimonadales bacterium]|nr:alkaline phosphatase family protein [Candidatus Saccharimonadales bacterium]